MAKVEASCGIHWLTGSTRASLLDVQSVCGRLSKAEGPGGFGHPMKRYHESGMKVYCGSESPDHPLVIEAPGEVCETWGPQIAGYLAQLGARCTRVDLAMDVEPAELARGRLLGLYQSWRRGDVETRIRRSSLSINKNEEGMTVYFDRRGCELFLRAYDKRGPLRVEFEWRPQGGAREIIPDLLVQKGPAQLWRRCASRVEFKADWYRQLARGDFDEVPAPERTESALNEAMYHLYKQQGLSLWMFGLIGFNLQDLQRVPDVLTGPQERKFRSWLDAHEKAGNDVTHARAELEKRCQR